MKGNFNPKTKRREILHAANHQSHQPNYDVKCNSAEILSF